MGCVSVAIAVACNTLTGIGDLDPSIDDVIDSAPPASEDVSQPPATKDAVGGGEVEDDAPAVCTATTCTDDAGAMVCADLAVDPKNCGTCGTTCETLANAVPTCAAGKCTL